MLENQYVFVFYGLIFSFFFIYNVCFAMFVTHIRLMVAK